MKIQQAYRRSQSVVFNSGQKMALRLPYVVICSQALWTFKVKRSQRHLLGTVVTTD